MRHRLPCVFQIVPDSRRRSPALHRYSWTPPSSRLARLLPLRQQAVRVNFCVNVVVDALESQTLLQRTVAPRIECIGASADVVSADEDLRDGLCTGAPCEHSTNLPTKIVLLVLDRIQVDTAI